MAMDKPRRKPNRPDAEKVVRIICMIVNEAIKVFFDMHGGR